MSELIITDTNSSEDSDGKAFGLSGNNYLYPAISLMVSLILFGMMFYGIEFELTTTILLSLPPFVLTTAYMWFLKEGKPTGYALDFFENLLFGSSWTLNPHNQPKNPLLDDRFVKTE